MSSLSCSVHPGALDRRLTCGTLALVAIGVINTFGSVEAGRAGAVVYVDLTHGTTEPWKAQTQRETQELLERAHPHSCTVRNYLLANPPSHPNRSSANLHAMASSSTHTHHTPDGLARYPTHPPKVLPSRSKEPQLETEMAKPNRNKADGAQVVGSMPACKTESPPIKIFEAIKAKNKTTE